MLTIESARIMAKEKFNRELSKLDVMVIRGLLVNGEVCEGLGVAHILDDVVSKNYKLWYTFRHRYGRSLETKGYKDDAEDLLYLAIAKAINIVKNDLREHQTMRYAFTTYVGNIYHGYIRRWLRYHCSTEKRKGEWNTVYFSEPVRNNDSGDTKKTVEDTLEGKECVDEEIEVIDIYEQLMSICDRIGVNRDVIRLAYEGYTQKEIGKYVGVGQVQISRLLSRVYKEYRKEMSKKNASELLDTGENRVSIRRLADCELSDRCKLIVLNMIEEEMLSQEYDNVVNK